MEILIGLLIIAVGAFCQSSCYVPINRIKDWSWESYWIVQGVFAWLIFSLFGSALGCTRRTLVVRSFHDRKLFRYNHDHHLWCSLGSRRSYIRSLDALFGRGIGTIDCLRNMCRIGNDYGSCLAEPVFPRNECFAIAYFCCHLGCGRNAGGYRYHWCCRWYEIGLSL